MRDALNCVACTQTRVSHILVQRIPAGTVIASTRQGGGVPARPSVVGRSVAWLESTLSAFKKTSKLTLVLHAGDEEVDRRNNFISMRAQISSGFAELHYGDARQLRHEQQILGSTDVDNGREISDLLLSKHGQFRNRNYYSSTKIREQIGLHVDKVRIS